MSNIHEKYKKVIADDLENKGVLNYVKSKIKSSIIDIIKNEKREVKRKLDFEMLTPFQKISKSKELMLLTHLIIEFLQFYEFDYTIPIFKGEANIKENIKKDTLVKDSVIKDYDDQQPILLQIINSHLNDRVKGFNRNIYDDPYYKKDQEVKYSGLGLSSGYSSGGGSNLGKGEALSSINLVGDVGNLAGLETNDLSGSLGLKKSKLAPMSFGGGNTGSNNNSDEKENKSKY